MNIDVREYLRINPISVHELTLSDDALDCFLFFPTDSNRSGYRAFTQTQLFRALQNSIFGDLLDYSASPPSIKPNNPHLEETVITGKFKNYVRRSEAKGFMDEFDLEMNDLESSLDDIIMALRRKGVLEYAGAVELQSNSTRSLEWESSTVLETVKIAGPIYKNMSYAKGQIWCKSTDSSIDPTGGSDEVSIGSFPLRHDHADTLAETLTGPLATKFGGGQLIGDFTIGSKEFVSQGTGYGPSGETTVSPLEHAIRQNETLTYPLWGQNVLDWRNPKKTHDNTPPSLNIYVRYCSESETQAVSMGSGRSTESCRRMLKRIAEIRESLQSTRAANSAEPQYKSYMACGLPSYVDENLTVHDYVLRILSNSGQQVKLMRQGLQMLLDIFAEHTNQELSTQDGTMKELLMKHLDYLLMPVSEFMQWYNERQSQLDRIEGKIETARQLFVSVPPLNYVGRIIVSYTDDTEQKVVANYGGKSWRRIENFLRGVEQYDPENIPGQKLGEEYVALRESNIPIHSHSYRMDGDYVPPEDGTDTKTQDQEWSVKNKGQGDVQIVNTAMMGTDSEISISIDNTNRNYQISPLEYESRGENEVAVPHDNLPPYMKMYIWECTEITDEERRITEEPRDDNQCVITWLYNGGTIGGDNKSTQDKKIGDIHNASDIPNPTYENHDFLGWKDMSGQIKTPEQIAGKTISGNETYIAQWTDSDLLVTFDGNGGNPALMTRKYKYNQEIGYFPTLDEYPDLATGVSGWYTAKTGGTKIDESHKLTNSDKNTQGKIIFYAHWNYIVTQMVTVKFFTYQGIEISGLRKTIAKGARIGELVNRTRTGYTFKGWFTARTDGDQVFATKKVNSDLNLYEQWIGDICTITWNPSYEGCETFQWEREYDSTLGTLPVASRTGYTFGGWFTEESEEVESTRTVKSSEEYYAHWKEIEYSISCDLKGGSWPAGADVPTKYYVYSNDISIPAPEFTGRKFLGWTGSNGSTPRVYVSIPKGTTGNKSYTANWGIDTYTVKFDGNGASGAMDDQIFSYGTYQRLNQNTFADSILVSFDGNGGVPAEVGLISLREFLGWAESAEGEKVYNDRQNVKDLTLGDSITLFAKWGNFSDVVLPDASRVGYTFDKWYTAPTGGTAVGESGKTYRPTATTTLYAQWKTNHYIVTFDPNGGELVTNETERYIVSEDREYDIVLSGTDDDVFLDYYEGVAEGEETPSDGEAKLMYEDVDGAVLCEDIPSSRMLLEQPPQGDTIDVVYDSNDEEEIIEVVYVSNYDEYTSKEVGFNERYGTLPTVWHEDYGFMGWFTLKEGGTHVTEDTLVSIPQDHTLYAHWKNDKMTLTFNTNGGFLPDDVSYTKECRIGQPFGELPDAYRNGFTFDGWFTNENWTNSVTSSMVAPEYDMEAIAKWNSIQYTIRFNANGGSGTMADQNVAYGTRIRLNPNQFTVPGCIFIGWATTPNGTSEFEDQQEVVNLSSVAGHVITLYAIYQEIPEYTVTFVHNDGTGNTTTTTQKYNTSLVAPSLARAGYTFTGWNPSVPDRMPAADSTYIAQWTLMKYTITFDANGGQGGWSRQMNYGETIVPPTVYRPTYEFSQWQPSVNATVPIGGATYVAQWTEPTYRFPATPMVPDSYFSWSFGAAGVGPTSQYWTLSDGAKQYLIDKYGASQYWNNIPIGGGGVDHLVFTHVPGRKKYTISMDIRIENLNVAGYYDKTANTQGNAEVVIFFVGQNFEISTNQSVVTTYIDGTDPTKITYRRARPGRRDGITTANQYSFILMSKSTTPSLAQAYNSTQHVTLEIDARNMTGGQMIQDWLDAWIYIDHSGNSGTSYLKAICTNCNITWSD